MCASVLRFKCFLDPLTIGECGDHSQSAMHVRTTDLMIIQNPRLRAAVGMGLNHIPLAPTDTTQAVNTTCDVFKRMYDVLHLKDFALDIHEACAFF